MAGGGPAVTVEGGPQLRRALGRAADRVDDTRDAHRAAGEAKADEARSLVPVRTGALYGSIRVELDDDGATVTAGSAGVPYARVVQYGWPDRNIEAQPYLGSDPGDAGVVIDPYRRHVDNVLRKLDREMPHAR